MVPGLKRLAALAAFVVLGALVLVGAGAGGSAPSKVSAGGKGLLDCNGFSPKNPSVKSMIAFCADPRSVENGKPARFEDNGHYIGHDEPSVKFISSAHGSGNHMSYYMQLPVDPSATPTPDGSVSKYEELSVAPWFGLPMCDPKSYPQNPCTPDSDTNTGMNSPTDAGSAFLEVQLYAPGFGPFADSGSCDPTRYCAALTIDSLECNFGFEFCNPNCIEPQQFAYIQRNGVPTGPPGPPDVNTDSLTPNDQTLFMNQGDSIRMTIKDTPDGLKVKIDDFTTGQSGYMVASGANGFKNVDLNSCASAPFDFHPEYDTAQQQNRVPWAALEGGVLMQQELGHFESCNGVSNALVFSDGTPFFPFDPFAFQTCDGGLEGPGNTPGEGPCNFDTGDCQNVSTEAGGQCPTNNFAEGGACEFEDGQCFPRGDRPVDPSVESTGVAVESWPVAGCETFITQNGDLDFDGNSYIADWPDGAANHPTPFRYAGPFDKHGDPYPQVQFETDVAASENNCDVVTGNGCVAKPDGAAFYPFFSIGKQAAPTGFPNDESSEGGAAGAQTASAVATNGHKHDHGNLCLWNFGNDIQGVTTQDFGQAAQYGAPDLAWFGGNLVSSIISNPQLSKGCKGKSK
jgi:hypothetical protein